MNQTSLNPLNSYHWRNIRLIATDMDGTLTQVGKVRCQTVADLK